MSAFPALLLKTLAFILKTWSTISRSSVMNMKWRTKPLCHVLLVCNVMQSFADPCSLEERNLQKRKIRSRTFNHMPDLTYLTYCSMMGSDLIQIVNFPTECTYVLLYFCIENGFLKSCFSMPVELIRKK